MNDDYWDDVDADVNHYGFDALHSFDEAHGYVADEFNALVTDYNLGNEKSLSLIHLNIRSLSRNFDCFVAELETLKIKFDIICISETWMHKNSPDLYFHDYVAHHNMRSFGRGGGVAIYKPQTPGTSFCRKVPIGIVIFSAP